MIMEHAQHFDVASLLSCLHQLRSENDRLEEKVRLLVARRDHLIAVNSRLSLPLNGAALNPSLSSLGSLPNHHGSVLSSQNGSHANSVSSSPLSFPSTNSGPNPSPTNVFDTKSPRCSPASSLGNGTGTASRIPDRLTASNHYHHQANDEMPGQQLPLYPGISPQFTMNDTPGESPFFQMMTQAPNLQHHQQQLQHQHKNTPGFQQTSCIRGLDRR